MNSIGEELKKLRLQRHMTQQELADLLFITRQAISSYETGKTTPDLQTLQRLGEIFNTDFIHLPSVKPLKNYSSLLYMVIVLMALINLIIRWNLGMALIGGDILIYIFLIMATTLYFIFNTMIKNEDYSLLAGFDSSLPYHYPTLKKMVLSMLHMMLMDIGSFMFLFLLMDYLNINTEVFPILFICFIFSFICSILLVNYRYKDQLLLKKVERPGSQSIVMVFLLSIFALVIMVSFVMKHFNISNNTPQAIQLLLIIFPYLIVNVIWLLLTDHQIKKAAGKRYPYQRNMILIIIVNILLLFVLYFMASHF